MELNLNQDRDNALFTGNNSQQFLVLGDADARRLSSTQGDKLKKQRTKRVSGIWATLGMADDSPPEWQGVLEYSRQGRTLVERAKQRDTKDNATEEAIGDIRTASLEGKQMEERFFERYISFRHVRFGRWEEEYKPESPPLLRLTLFVEPGEGALVFQQFGTFEKGKLSQRTSAQFIQPNPTTRNSCSDRDRLDYIFALPPPNKLEEAPKSPRAGKSSVERKKDVTLRLSGKRHYESFVLKILTFPRENSESHSILARLGKKLQLISHELLLWDPESGLFQPRDGSALDPNFKTLFLIHGTFSETKQAFKGLIDGKKNSWVGRQWGKDMGRYPQIIAFDHPTIFEGPDENVRAFLERLPRGFQFKERVDVVTHSRGGLLAQWIAHNSGQIPLGKGALVACANGVGYFTAGWRVAKFLSVTRRLLKRSPSPVAAKIGAFVTGLAQHSAEFFLKLPGSVAMTPGSDFLQSLAGKPPLVQPKFMPVVGDFKKSLVREDPLFKRWAAYGLDVVIMAILGRRHDWVVGSEQQAFVPKDTLAQTPWTPFARKQWIEGGWKKSMVPARHSEYFRIPSEPVRRLNTFLR